MNWLLSAKGTLRDERIKMMWIWQINNLGSHVHRLGVRVFTFVDITLGVSPIAFGHKARVVWTADGWNTACWSDANWIHNPGGHFEEWKVSLIVPGQSIHPGADPTYRFWYALSVEDASGFVVWDNNHGWNYEYIVHGRSPDIVPVPCP